jgi:hypothetical protein
VKISHSMNLGELAARMGSVATEDEALAMRELLAERYDGEDTAEIGERDWICLLELVTEPEDQNEYEIHGYSVRMTEDQATAWNDGDLSAETLKGAVISPNADDWVDLWSAINDDGGSVTPLSDELNGYPANLIR